MNSLEKEIYKEAMDDVNTDIIDTLEGIAQKILRGEVSEWGEIMVASVNRAQAELYDEIFSHKKLTKARK